jgi:hypothetical protein
MTTEIDPALTGSAYDLANGGYMPMADAEKAREQETIGGDGASLRGAADRRGEHDVPIMVRAYVDADGNSADTNEAITLTRAARDHARLKAAERHASADERAEALAQQVDQLRGAVQANDPSAAEFYGFEARDRQGSELTDDRAEAATAADQLAPQLEKALKHPQVLQAIEERVAEAEKARQSYREGLAAAMQIAQTSFLGQFPEFSSMHPDHVPAALEKMSREDPAKFARIQAAVTASEGLLARQAHENQRQAEASQQSFQKFASGEDARLETMLKDEPTSVRHAVATEILDVAKENGIEPAELNRLFHTEPVMRNAVFQRMMYDAAKYRLMMKAKDAVAARPVPPVLRPGVATAATERGRTDLRSLNARLSSSGNLKDAVALYQARKFSGS